MAASTTAQGMKSYVPRRTPGSVDDVVTSKDREMAAQERRERAATKAAGEAYDKAMPSPDKYAKGGVTRGDGIAKKGHTKGRMC